LYGLWPRAYQGEQRGSRLARKVQLTVIGCEEGEGNSKLTLLREGYLAEESGRNH